MAVCLVPALIVVAVLLWIVTNAILHGRGITREAAITIASLRVIDTAAEMPRLHAHCRRLLEQEAFRSTEP